MTDASDLTPLMESSSNQEYVPMELEQAPTTNSTTENMSDFDQLSNSVSQSNSIDPPNSGNSSNRRDSVPRVFTFDDASVVATQLIDTLREKLTHLPSIEVIVGWICDCRLYRRWRRWRISWWRAKRSTSHSMS